MRREKKWSVVPKGIRRNIEVALRVMGRRSVGGRERVGQLKKELDGG